MCIRDRLGIINGYGDGNFLPEESLKGIEAIKILTAALGYQIVAENEGGYQSGYLTCLLYTSRCV